MINLFNIPDHVIFTTDFSHILHDHVVTDFEETIADYVGAKYACGFNSASSAIFLTLADMFMDIQLPSIIPPVVVNAAVHSGNYFEFVDNVDWVGNSYVLVESEDYKIIDSAQKLTKDQFKLEANDEDLMIFSFYPTKPVGSIDGGMIVSNDKEKIDYYKAMVMNGMSQEPNSWERKQVMVGWKMYMNSVQAYIAKQNFRMLPLKESVLADVCAAYNKAFNLNNTSQHLYRIAVDDNDKFIEHMKTKGIICGKHYEAAHLGFFKDYHNGELLPKSEHVAKTTVSLPYHENLAPHDVEYIIQEVKSYETG